MTNESYAARLEIDYSESLDRFTTFFRIIWAIPIVIVLALLNAASNDRLVVLDEAGEVVEQATDSVGGITASLFLVTMLLIVFRQKYPRWWFDFALEFTRFTTRVGAYVLVLTDDYPSTTDEQAVHLELDYPEATELNRWLPLVKWLLAFPHYIVLVILWVVVVPVTIIGWFAILFAGRYPQGLFDYVVGVIRWSLRVDAYAFLLLTDEYPAFSLR
ncbi:MAG: DUF4389 domain-containing protein [Acidimicrobiia bacterium]|nr:DUF4389 domain-containing protein [Acidimicrobiia bacterium]